MTIDNLDSGTAGGKKIDRQMAIFDYGTAGGQKIEAHIIELPNKYI